METRHDTDSLIEAIQTLRYDDAEKMIVEQRSQLNHIIFDAEALLKANKLLTSVETRKINLIINYFPIDLNTNVDKIITLFEVMPIKSIEELTSKLKAEYRLIGLMPRDFTKLLKKIGYEKARYILPLISVDFESMTKSKYFSEYMLEVFTYSISHYKTCFDELSNHKAKISYRDAASRIAEINDLNLPQILRIMEPLFKKITSFNEFCPLFTNFFRNGRKYGNEVTLMGDSHYNAKCALRERFRHLIKTQHELNQLTKCLPEKKRGEFNKAQHDFWQSQVTAPANNPNALFNQNNNNAPSAPPAKEVLPPEYLNPPQQPAAQPSESAPPANDHSDHPEPPKADSTCRLM